MAHQGLLLPSVLLFFKQILRLNRFDYEQLPQELSSDFSNSELAALLAFATETEAVKKLHENKDGVLKEVGYEVTP
ncbi:MAG: hypothetical protein GY915_03040, partial [bacterium]|nr:hypothetical protein [bacterium]